MVFDTIEDIKEYSLALITGLELKVFYGFVVVYLADYTGLSKAILHIFFLVLVFDFALGFFKALKEKRFVVHSLTRGMAKIALWVFYIILMSYSDRALYEIFGVHNYMLAKLLIVSIIFTEISSILRHCQDLGLPIPEGLLLMGEGGKNFIISKIKNIFSSSKSGSNSDSKLEHKNEK